MSFDPEISEWGNPLGVNTQYSYQSVRVGTEGTETSKYLEEKKENSIPSVAASEQGSA